MALKKTKKSRWQVLDKAFYGSLYTIAIIEFSMMGSVLIDGIITTRYLGSTAMAAVGMGYPIFSIVSLFAGVLSSGMQYICSKEIGKGNYKTFDNVASMTLIVGLAISLLLAFLIAVFVSPVAQILGARGNSADLLEPAREYILGLCIGLPAIMTGLILAPALQLDNDARLVRISTILDAVFDIALDYLFVKLGMGLLGIGLATSVARYMSLAVLLFHFKKKDKMLHLTFRFSSLKLLPGILYKGSSMGVRRLANVIRPIVINNFIIALGGTAAMTALSIKNNVGQFAEIFGTGVAGTVPLVMGVAIGERSYDDVRHMGKKVHQYSIYGNVMIAVLAVILSPWISKFYAPDDVEIQKMVIFSFYMLGIELVWETLLYSRVGYLNLISKVTESQLLQFGLRFLAIVPSILIMGILFGVYGVLAGFAVGKTLLAVVVYVVNAIRCRKAKVTVDDYQRLDSSFNVPPEDVIELDVRGPEDAPLLSEQVQLFCQGHKLDKRKSYYAALAIEESVHLIYENNDFSTKTAMDVRIMIQDGDVMIRIRDNGRSSYPFAGLSNEDNDEKPFAYIGIKMLRMTAKDIKHYHSLKINFTFLTV